MINKPKLNNLRPVSVKYLTWSDVLTILVAVIVTALSLAVSPLFVVVSPIVTVFWGTPARWSNNTHIFRQEKAKN